jgi:hypothetical protein
LVNFKAIKILTYFHPTLALKLQFSPFLLPVPDAFAIPLIMHKPVLNK